MSQRVVRIIRCSEKCAAMCGRVVWFKVMTLRLFQLVSIALVVLQSASGSVLIPRCSLDVVLPVTFPTGSPFVHPVTVPSNNGRFKMGKVTLEPDVPEWTRKIRKLFACHSSNGSLYLRTALRELDQQIDLKSKSIIVTILSENEPLATVTIKFVKNFEDFCAATDLLCFSTPNLCYSIPESILPNTVIDVFDQPVVQLGCPDIKMDYSVSNGKEIATFDSNSTSLLLKSSLDAELETQLTFDVTCNVTRAGIFQLEHHVTAKLEVTDVNDNPPYLQANSSTIKDVDLHKIKSKGVVPIHLSVLDRDNKGIKNMKVYIADDPMHFFSIFAITSFAFNDSNLIAAEVRAEKPVVFPGPIYQFKVIFEDTTLVQPNANNSVTFLVRIHNKTSETFHPGNASVDQVIFSRAASIYARVAQPFSLSLSQHTLFEFSLSWSPNSDYHLFGITHKTGIIYLNDTKALRRCNDSIFILNVTWTSHRHVTGNHILLVNITNDPLVEQCGLLCAEHDNESECSSRCGRGTPKGHCQWRNMSDSVADWFSTEYATCSSNLETCPDKECDELERAHKSICPQDCADHVKGEAPSFPSAVGITSAKGTCYCQTVNTCSCSDAGNRLSVHNGDQVPRQQTAMLQRKGNKSVVITAEIPLTNHESPSMASNSDVYSVPGMKASAAACGPTCMLIVLVSCSLGVIAGVVLLSCHRLRHHRIKQKKAKHGCSRISLSVVPSDYVDERRPSSVQGEPTVAITTSTDTSSVKWTYENKWEFSRQFLILEQTLGEGEFGKVVKAQAWAIDGHQGYSTVAVKMLKGNGSSSELQDLMSEFNLLKEVQHPNIVRLLGACTQKDGPLYVIVEYAEHGSLRQYLRHCRHLDFDPNAQIRTVDNPSYMLNSVAALTQRDLLSFAWQIAKGMAYLSDMKLVHRDLAARNVLLSSGHVIKISDFGLSRDVYEGDTYFKRSKGRVPVKWMALESLKDHVYTAKSDVWSFGVVLWEIVTLAASPYPGISPERLYQLLQAGYRMERPENCSEALYQVMRMCWRESPFERPQFKELAQKFDQMLEDTAVYLDLNALTTDRKLTGDELSGVGVPTLNDSDSDGPSTPLTKRYPSNAQIVYGKISFAPPDSSYSEY